MQASNRSRTRTIESYDFLPPEPAARRPVGGQPARPVLIEDAVFEVVGPSWTDYPLTNDNPAPDNHGERHDYLRFVAFAGVNLINRAEALLARLSMRVFLALLGLSFLIAFWLFGGLSSLTARPQAAMQPGLTIQDIQTVEEDANGMKLLVVGGLLVNNSDRAIDVPDLTVEAGSGQPIGKIERRGGRMEPQATLRFMARFKLAGGKSGTIVVFPTPL